MAWGLVRGGRRCKDATVGAGLLLLSLLPVGCYSGASTSGDADGGSTSAGTSASSDGTADSGDTTSATTSGEETEGETPTPDARGPAIGRRLIREEYFNSIEVALGVQVDPEDFDLPEDFRLPGGFRNSSAELLLSPGRIAVYEEVAGVVAQSVDITSLIETHATCTDLEEDCFRPFVGDLALRVLRRPIPEAEADLYVGLFDVAMDEEQGFEQGARLVVRAMLQSPRFIYRLELPGVTGDGNDSALRVDDYELATRLSFLLWNAAPDLELLRIADAGGLDGELPGQVSRMLAHPRARTALRQYIEQWLYLDATPANLLLRDAMQEETYRLFERIVWEEDADFMQAFASQEAELSPELAEFYGLTPQGPGSVVYDLSDLPGRIGVTTHAGVMAARTVNPDTSMIDRGLFVLNDVFCGSVPPPDAEGLEDAIEENAVPAESGLSQRERFAMQSETPLCASCHGVFDPLGLPYENFGPAGEFRSEDEYGNVLTGQSVVLFGDVDGDFANVEEFAVAVSTSSTVARCMVKKSVQHAYGRVLGEDDDLLIDRLASDFDDSGHSFKELLSSIALRPEFKLVGRAE